MIRILFIGISLFLAACGAESPYSSASNQDALYADGVKVALSAANPGAVDEYKIAIAFDAQQTSVSVCAWNGTACQIGNDHTAAFSANAQSRSIYQTQTFLRIDANTTYAVVYKGAGDTVDQVFKFKLTPKSQDNPIVNSTGGAAAWKHLYVTGDNEFNAWDNARRKLMEMFTARGVPAANMKALSMAPGQQTGGIGQTSKANIQSALRDMTSGEQAANGENCMVFMTSHGSRQGFFLRNQGTISPSEFSSYLDATCGDRPTVAIISACYSGVMINPQIQKPNRIILTAASRDKTSFGCDARSTYTFFDQCVIETLPKATTWKQFSEMNVNCVKNLEQQRNMPHFSNPQVYIGSAVQDLKIPSNQ